MQTPNQKQIIADDISHRLGTIIYDDSQSTIAFSVNTSQGALVVIAAGPGADSQGSMVSRWMQEWAAAAVTGEGEITYTGGNTQELIDWGAGKVRRSPGNQNWLFVDVSNHEVDTLAPGDKLKRGKDGGYTVLKHQSVDPDISR